VSSHPKDPSVESKSTLSRQSHATSHSRASHRVSSSSPHLPTSLQPIVVDQPPIIPPATNLLSPTSEKELRFNQSIQRFKEMHLSSQPSTANESGSAGGSSVGKEPFNLQAAADSVLPQDAVLSLDVRVSDSTVEKLEFRPGESPYGLAAIFVAMHKLPTSYIKPLASEIQGMMNQHTKRFPVPVPPPPSAPAPLPPQPDPSPTEDVPIEASPVIDEIVNKDTTEGGVSEAYESSMLEPEDDSPTASPKPYRRSLADSILSPPRLYSRPRKESLDDKSQSSGHTSLPSRGRSRSSSFSSLWHSKRVTASEVSHLKSRDSLSIASHSSTSKRRSRSVSPLSQSSSSIHDRLFRDAESNARNRERVKNQIQKAEEKELETRNRSSPRLPALLTSLSRTHDRIRRSRSFSATTVAAPRDQADNPGAALYLREMKWVG
jgi:hypothetical protein